MKQSRLPLLPRLLAFSVLALGLCALSSPARASTLAYWRFGDDPAGPTPAAGDWITPTAGRTTVEVDAAPNSPPAFVLGRDSSGNGNSLYTWDDTFSGHNYRAFAPNNSSLRSGASNAYSIQNNGGFPATFTWSAKSAPSLDVEPVTPASWTIEASIYKTANSQHQTFVGRDGNGVAPSDGSLAPLYFKTIDGNLQIQYTDVAGNIWNATDAADIDLNTWYNVAAVSNGSTLSLYKDSGAGYQLVASRNISSSANSALAYDTAGANNAGDTQWGWSIGRGRYSTDNSQAAGHTDRWLGYVDEVRISNAALTPDEFLFVPKFSLIAEVTTSGPNAGNVTLKNIDSAPVTFNYYLLGSAANALSPAGWNSLSDQSYDAALPADFNGSGGAVDAADLAQWTSSFGATAGGDADADGDTDGQDFLIWQRQLGQVPGPGDSWDEAGGSTAAKLAELFLNSASTLNPGESVNLGNAYNAAIFGAANGDLTFKYGIPGQPLLTAAVVYKSGTPATAVVPEPSAIVLGAMFAVSTWTTHRRRRAVHVQSAAQFDAFCT
jgi:hypothetical protein